MKKLSIILLIILSLTVSGVTQNDVAKFRYNAKKAFSVGTVLHYVKTNIDGTKPEQVSQFIAAPDAMESFKFHPKQEPAGFVTAKMNWKLFSAKTIISHQVFADGKRNFFGEIGLSEETKRVTVFIPSAKSETESFAVEKFPVHLYNFDVGSLNFAFPHLLRPQDSFTIGVIDPTFRENAPLVEYKGEVTISYIGDENRNDVLTRKYKIDGAGLQNRGGYIWINKKHFWIEDMEIALPDNPEWTSFKLKLLKVEKMNRAEWEKFMKSQF